LFRNFLYFTAPNVGWREKKPKALIIIYVLKSFQMFMISTSDFSLCCFVAAFSQSLAEVFAGIRI